MTEAEKTRELYLAIKDSLPPEIAMVLAKSSGAGSKDELKFLVGLICNFKNIAFHGYVNGTNGIELSAKYAEDEFSKNYYLIFSFQHRVKNVTPKSPDWRCDIVVSVYANSPIENQKISSIAFEYDGHVRHYVESEIKKQMRRDAHIFEKESLPTQRVSPELAKNDPDLYRRAIKKYAHNHISIHRKTVDATLSKLMETGFTIQQAPLTEPQNTPLPKKDPFIDCPACKTKGSFGPITCQLCGGHGRLLTSATIRSDLLNFFSVPCLACYISEGKIRCRYCGGSRTMDNIQALEYAKKNSDDYPYW